MPLTFFLEFCQVSCIIQTCRFGHLVYKFKRFKGKSFYQIVWKMIFDRSDQCMRSKKRGMKFFFVEEGKEDEEGGRGER